MVDHLVAYVQVGILSRWKRLSLKYARDGAPIFAYGSDDDRQFAEYAKDGAVLWIIASHRDHPPSLTARLAGVQRIDPRHRSGVPASLLRELKHPNRDGPYAYRVKGGKGSRFFGHNDVRSALTRLGLLGHQGDYVKAPAQPWDALRHGSMMVRSYRVHDATPLTEFAARLRRATVFVSWKHADMKGRKRENVTRRRWVMAFVRALTRHDVAVWLDDLALPDYMPRTRDDELLDLLLKQGLRQSRFVVAVATHGYATKSCSSRENWTKKEWQSKRRRHRAVLYLEGVAQPSTCRLEAELGLGSDELRLTGSPSQAALQLVRALG